jgi:hypothetical protein
MKVYITRRGQADYVTDAPTVADAIVRFWLTTGEQPKPSYRVHFGRKRQSRVVSAAVCYWILKAEMRSALSSVIQETTSAEKYQAFCDTVIQAGTLLGD